MSIGGGVVKKGFTLIELAVSLLFFALLSISIVAVINNAIFSYQRGLVLNRVNSTGNSFVDDMKNSIQDAISRTDLGKNVSVSKTDEVTIGGEEKSLPVYGAFCTGDYSYVWNSGYYKSGNATFALKGTSDGDSIYAQIRYKEGDHTTLYNNGSFFKFIKVKDIDRAICLSALIENEDGTFDVDNESLNNVFDISNIGSGELGEVVDLLPNDGDNDLAIYDLSVTVPAINASEDISLYSVSFILGTISSGVNIISANGTCAAPVGDANWDNNCAVTRFSFVAQSLATEVGVVEQVFYDDPDSRPTPTPRPDNPTPSGPSIADYCDESTSYLQDWTGAASLPVNRRVYLRDRRDEKCYSVTKLPDNNVWMTTNLDLEGGKTLTSADTNIAQDFELPASSTTRFSEVDTAYVYNSGNEKCDKSVPCYSYYSWYAATGGTGTQNITGGNVGYDICPKGWRLPTSVDYNLLSLVYGNGDALSGKWGGVYGGYVAPIAGSSLELFNQTGQGGYYWTSTAAARNIKYTNAAYDFEFLSGDTSIDIPDRRFGLAVRCIKKATDLTGQEYKINYYSNDGTNRVTSQNVRVNAAVALIDSPWTRDGYEFKGWNTAMDGSGISYNANDTVVNLGAPGDSATLYAIWEKITCIASTPYMQDWNAYGSIGVGETIYLRDKRDEKCYSVAKLSGGNVWMTTNLDLDGGVILTSALSNVYSVFTLPASTSNSSQFTDDGSAYVYNSGKVDCTTGPCYSLYSFVAAVAGTDTASGSSASDICPAGWRLPDRAELNELASAYPTVSGLTNEPFAAVYSGYASNNTVLQQTTAGAYWSSTAASASNGYQLYFDQSNISVKSERKALGAAVRCMNKAANVAATTRSIIYVRNIDSSDNTAEVQQVRLNSQTTIQGLPTSWARSGYALAGWSTTRSGTGGTIYRPGDSYAVTGDLTLYAQWTVAPTNYTVRFDANGGSGTMADQIVNRDTSVTLNANKFTRANHNFTGWCTNQVSVGASCTGTRYANSASIYNIASAGSTITLYAQWSVATRAITYIRNNDNSDNTSNVQQAQLNAQATIQSLPSSWTRSGYSFTGWSTTRSGAGGTTYQPGNIYTVTGDLTLYAQWTANTIVQTVYSCGSTPIMQYWKGTLNIDSSISLCDSRDGQIYNVTRLADNKIWMTQSLRLNFGNTNTVINVSNTNRPSEQFLKNISTYPPQRTDAWKWNYQDVSFGSLLYRVYNSSETYYSSGAAHTNNYYGDICPAGWRLPNENDITALNNAVSSANSYSYYYDNYFNNSIGFYESGHFGSTWGGEKVKYYWANEYEMGVSSTGIYLSKLTLALPDPVGMMVRCVRDESLGLASDEFYSVYFYQNYGSNPSKVQQIPVGKQTNLAKNTFKRSGYNFTGWNTSPNGSGTAYSNEQLVTNIAASGGVKNLYAQWASNSGSMKNWNCNMQVGDTATLTDPRDNNTYTVVKLVDGKCWMSQNLRLNFSSSGDSITSANTHNPSASFLEYVSTKPSQDTDDWSILYNTNYSNVYRYRLYNSSTVYYNYNAALAGSGYSGDLCPKGWRLPSSSDISNLASYMEASKNYAYTRAYFNDRGFYENSRTSTWSGEDAGYYWADSNCSYGRCTMIVYSGPSTVASGSLSSLPSDIGALIRCLRDASLDGSQSDDGGGSYTVKFDANGGSGTMANQTISRGTSTVLNANTFTYSGYSFSGWCTNKMSIGTNCTGTHYANAASVYNIANAGATITLYAEWAATTYTVKFDANGGSGTMANQTINRDVSTALKANSFIRSGYSFYGWCTNKMSIGTNCTGTHYANAASVYNIANAGATITLYAEWVTTTYTVKFNANGGSGTMTDQTMYRNRSTALTANKFTRSSYKFGGWCTNRMSIDATCNGTHYNNGAYVNNIAGSGSSVTLYAEWETPGYTIKFVGNGSTSGTMSDQYIKRDTTTSLSPNAYIRSGGIPPNQYRYIFDGWCTNRVTAVGGTCTGTHYSDRQSVRNIANAGATIYLYAQWKRDTYTVKFNSNGGTGGTMADQTIVRGVSTSLSGNKFSKTGYTFMSWCTNRMSLGVNCSGTRYSNGQQVLNLASSGGSITLYAEWRKTTYGVLYYANDVGYGFEAINVQQILEDTQTVLTKNTFVREGYIFAGWNTERDGTGTAYSDEQLVENITDGYYQKLYAQWIPNIDI